MRHFITLCMVAAISWSLPAHNVTLESDENALRISTFSQKACFPMVSAGNAAVYGTESAEPPRDCIQVRNLTA